MDLSEKSQSSRVQRGHRRHGSRYKARSRAVELLFEAELRDLDPVELVAVRSRESAIREYGVKPVPAYTREILAGVAQELNGLDEVIADHLTDDWELYRIAGVDRAILRVVVWEMLFNDEVPPAVATVEGTELASQYSADSSPAYINAMLDVIAKQAEDLALSLRVTTTADETTAFAFPEHSTESETVVVTDDAGLGDNGVSESAASESTVSDSAESLPSSAEPVETQHPDAAAAADAMLDQPRVGDQEPQ
ncbi:hypothetical protein CCHOA_06340 [Corynebacterium choanae]|uniref:Transcription antitermination protein NusB n=2 Tax=Corynebacterium choanae TaxID=1862358 RepID=A0A3G6J6G9_9CORY|nr:hypothetical protein CCHOA_06340 [Corynebacterium choanae]